MRKLASIRKIHKIEPIENADAIEKAVIDGWQVVVKKGEFKEGEFVIYVEIDSFVPHSLAPFLTRGNEQPKIYKGILGERLRTASFRGCLSQGLVLPVPDNLKVEFGKDVSEELGIIKFEEEFFNPLDGCTYKNLPANITSSELERVQNISLSGFEDVLYEVTEKIDGTSCIFYLDEHDNLCVGTRNYCIGDGKNTPYGQIMNNLNIKEKFKSLGENAKRYAIYGEIFGKKISVTDYKINQLNFLVFNIFDKILHEFLPQSKRIEICNKMGLKHVPIIENNFSITGKEYNDLLELANGYSEINPTILREGVVFKSLDGKKSFKVISNKFLLKSEKKQDKEESGFSPK